MNSTRRPAASLLYALTCVLCAAAITSSVRAAVHAFPGEVLSDIDADRRMREPSGAVYHAGRDTLFVVGDEGDIIEFSLTGELLHHRKLSLDYDADLEGVTWAEPTGMLYIVVEMQDTILEVDPDDLTVRREFPVQRSVGDSTVIAEGGQGLEGITFVPDDDDQDGGTFYVVNQGFEDSAEDDASAILQIRVPLRARRDITAARILRHIPLTVFNVAAIHFDAHATELHLFSQGTLCRATMDGEIRETYAMPGDEPEGIAFDGSGHMYFARDSGGIMKAKMSELFRAP